MGLALVKGQARSEQKSTDVEDTSSDGIDFASKTKVQNIYIDGVLRTEDKLLTKQLEKLFDADTFERVVEEAHLGKLRLERLGILQGSDVFIDVARGVGADPDGLDIHYLIKEKKRITVSTGTEVGNNEGSLSFNCNVNNFHGKAEKLTATASIGTSSTSSYQLGFGRPLFRNPDITFQLNCLRKWRDIPTSFYKERSNGFGVTLTAPSPAGIHSISWDGVWRENASVPQTAPFVIREQLGHSLKSSIKHVFISDGRDSWFFPTRGHLMKHTVEYAGLGGDTKFIKSEAELQLNKEITNNIVVGMTFRAGAMKSLHGHQIAINDRFFLGGPLSVRGFTLNGIGPRVQSASLGADTFWATGLHLYTPLPFKPGQGGFGDLFRTHMFVSAGSLGSIDLTNPSTNSFKTLLANTRWSYGAGIMFMLGGVARLEVNYCIPKGTRPDDGITPGLQFGIGMSFL